MATLDMKMNSPTFLDVPLYTYNYLIHLVYLVLNNTKIVLYCENVYTNIDNANINIPHSLICVEI